MKFPHPGHEKHLCKIWSDTYNVDEVIPAATNQENLCDPTPLE
jgi:hypothetical protein